MWSDPKDPAIKLFGKTIQLPDLPAEAALADAASDHPVDDDEHCEDAPSSLDSNNSNGAREKHELEKIQDCSDKKTVDTEDEGAQPLTSETDENLKEPVIEQDSGTDKIQKSEDEQSEVSNSQEKILKKPDKILPCPRCNSMDTKFCYFNNYNVNQPRHFCKNCQRYWTAGGTMRNMAVGAGRRKNKNSSSHYRHITVPESLLNAHADLMNGVNHPSQRSDCTVLAFGSDTPLCGDNMDNQSGGSSVTAASSKDEVGTTENSQKFPPLSYFPGTPWASFPWNSPQWNSPGPPPSFCPSSFPVSFYAPAAPYWNCSWNVPWISPVSGPNSPTLGKHSREEEDQGQEQKQEQKREIDSNKCLWVPKTLRIHDPGEAAKSSILVALGIKSDKSDSMGDERDHISGACTALKANPAAFSRSLNFRESS